MPQLVPLRVVADARGMLAAVEAHKQVPFIPRRCFWLYSVPSDQERGGHAHRQCQQFLVCVSGSVVVETDDGSGPKRMRLPTCGVGMHVEPMVWVRLLHFYEDAVLMVLASDAYDPTDYVSDYDAFRKATASGAA